MAGKQGDNATVQSKPGDLGYKQVSQQPQQQPAPAPSGGGYGGYGGGGGGSRRSYSSASSKPSKADQEKQQATVDNLGDIYKRKKGDLEDQTNNAINVIKDKQKANNATLKTQQSQINRGIDWQPQQQKEQSTMMALRNRMGNAAYGSGIVDLMEGMGRVDDMADTQLINTWKQNMDNAYNNWFQADTELVGDYNEALADSEQKMADLFNQYQAALNNVNPLAAKTANINKASKNAAKVQPALDSIENAKEVLRSARLNAKANSTPATKKAVTSAKKALQKARKERNNLGVSVGEGTEKITLPNIDMSPSSAFSKLIKNKAENASSVNPLTSSYVRPDAADTHLGGKRGQFNTAMEANSAFADNLRAFRNPANRSGTESTSSAATRAASAAAKNSSNQSLAEHLNNIARQEELRRRQNNLLRDKSNRATIENNANIARLNSLYGK